MLSKKFTTSSKAVSVYARPSHYGNPRVTLNAGLGLASGSASAGLGGDERILGCSVADTRRIHEFSTAELHIHAEPLRDDATVKWFYYHSDKNEVVYSEKGENVLFRK